jgi:hypothetical protein
MTHQHKLNFRRFCVFILCGSAVLLPLIMAFFSWKLYIVSLTFSAFCVWFTFSHIRSAEIKSFRAAVCRGFLPCVKCGYDLTTLYADRSSHPEVTPPNEKPSVIFGNQNSTSNRRITCPECGTSLTPNQIFAYWSRRT